jgi:hypothetical protein
VKRESKTDMADQCLPVELPDAILTEPHGCAQAGLF